MKVGFLGLGTQGKGLALNAVAAGFSLTVFDIREEPCTELAAAGARVADSAAQLARESEIIQICLLDDAQVRSVVPVVIEHAAEHALIAIHSTVHPATVHELATLGLSRGITVVDAPVSGGAVGARAKRMSFMVGGPQEAVARLTPLMQASGPAIQHVGLLGSGLRAKLAHQVIIAINLMAAHEGMSLGVASGLPSNVLETVVRNGAANSHVAGKWFSLGLGPHAAGVFYKDLKIALEFAHGLGLSMPGAALVQQLLRSILPVTEPGSQGGQ